MASLLDILAWRNISRAVQRVETGIPDRLPPEFNSLTENVLGDRTTYVTFYGQRAVARRAEYGAQSRPRTLKQIGEQSVTLLHFAEHIKIRQELMMRLRQPDDLLAQQMAQMEIARHGADLRQLFDNTRVAAQTFMLAQGKVWFDAAGNVLPSATGASLTVDYNIGANNRNQLNGIIDKTWSDPTAAIIQHVENVRVQMRRNTGRMLKNAFYGKNIPNYLFTNNTLKAYWQFNSKMYESFAANPGAVPNGFAGLNWHPMGETFFDDQNGVTQSIFPDDQVTFSPAIERNVYTLYEGSLPVPRSFQIAGDAAAAASNYEIVYGVGGYAVPEYDPIGIKEVYFDTMMPMWKNGLDMFIADTTF